MGFLPGRPGDRSNLKHRHGGAEAAFPGGANPALSLVLL